MCNEKRLSVILGLVLASVNLLAGGSSSSENSDAEIPAEYMPVGYFDYTDEFLEAVEIK